MANEVESRKLNDLRVVDLRYELEKRDLDKTGIKAVLLERLHKALIDEGHDPEIYVFEMMDVKRISGRGKDDEKVDEDDDTQTPGKLNTKNEIVDSTINKGSQNLTNETNSPNDISKKDVSELDVTMKENDQSNLVNMSVEQKDDDIKKIESGLEESEKEIHDNSFSNELTASAKEVEKITQEKSVVGKVSPHDDSKLISSTTPLIKEQKHVSEVNGIADNEDSINLTIGEDEEKLLADEEDSSQEKEQKDEGHGSSSHKMTNIEEKTQEKTNQEKMEGKSGPGGAKTLKEDKGKKIVTSTSNSRNLWVSGLATTTRATDLKQVFSKYGKVIGAKVVTNARTPGARCYGYVTMSNADDAHKAVQFLHHTELHGRLISVEKAKGDSTGPPKRLEPVKVESPVKKPEDKKKEVIIVKAEVRKEDNIVPPGTEGDVKEPVAPGTEDIVEHKKEPKEMSAHRNPELVQTSDTAEKRLKSSTASSHRSTKGSSPVLTFEKIKEERDRQRLREKERLLRDEERRRETERLRQREIDRKQREEFERLDREKKKIKMERERLLREKDELLRLKSERQRLERERQKLERERLEKEKEELERLKRQNLRLEEETRRKRSLSNSRDYEGRKRPATDTRYIGHHSSQSRYPEQSRSTEYKKEQTQHKSSRDLVHPPARRPGFESESSRRLIASVSTGSRESWPPKDRESGRFERTSISGGNFRDDTLSSRSKPSESRHVRERYSDGSKGDRYIERSSDSWHGGGGSGGPIKSFSGGRDTWVSGGGDRKQDHVPEPWSRNSSSRWPGSSTPIGLSSRSGPQSGVSSPIFPSNNIPGMPGIGMGMSNVGPFSGGDRFDAYKQPYFKGP